MVLISVRSCVFRLEFHFKALLISFERKHRDFSLPGLERHAEELVPFYLSYDKPFGELALGENCTCIKIISHDKSNSLGMFLEILTDTLKCHVFYAGM